MTKRYPFKFLNSYGKTDTDIFFGRDPEIEALYQMTFQSDILLVYGASGTGKTSLINCGLASRFQVHDWLALNIRRGHDLNAALQQKLDEAVSGPDSEAADLDLSWLDEDEDSAAESGSALSQQLQTIYRQYFRPIYLVFDQFEELYVLGSKAEQVEFIRNVQEIQSVEHPVKMIFVIREEYLGHLFEFERSVPQLLRKKLRVEPMNLDKVGQVVRGAAELERSNIRLQAGEETAIIEGIFEKIKGKEQTLAIQLPYLQVFLDKLYLHITRDESQEADALFTIQALSEIGDIGDVLRSFLEEQAIRIQKTLASRHAGLPEDTVWQILSPLATLEGTKEPMLEAILIKRLPALPPAVVSEGLRLLEQQRILRFDENEGRYEVAHDSLAARIAEHRSDDEIAILEIRRLINSQMALKQDAREFFSEKQLNLIDPYLDKLGLEQEALELIEKSRKVTALERAERRRNLIFATTLVLAVIVAVVFAIYANAKAKEAINAKKDTSQALVEAENQRARSDSLSVEAQAATIEALTQKAQSDSLSLKAQQARNEAQSVSSKLNKTTSRFVDDFLKEAEQDILKLDYESASRKIKMASVLEHDQEGLGKVLMEIMFVYNEAGSHKRAVELVDDLKKLLGSDGLRLNQDTLTSLNTFLKKLNTDHYNFLNNRYFPEMIKVDGGNFDKKEMKSFVIAKYETTVWQYNLFCLKSGKDNIQRTQRRAGLEGNSPVVNVNWHDAVNYSNWLSSHEGLTKVYQNSNEVAEEWITITSKGYRLPTKAEWVYAAKNDLNLFDMSDNVWEWCWEEKIQENQENQENPGYVYCSDSLGSNKAADKESDHTNGHPNDFGFNLGFRVVRSLPFNGQ